MFRELTIHSYRGLSECVFPDLGRINIIIGENNSGKTSVLEAIQLFEDREVLFNIISIARQREPQMYSMRGGNLSPFERFQYVFPIQKSHKEISVYACNDKEEYHLDMQALLQKGLFFREEMTESEWERYKTLCDEDATIGVIDGQYHFKYGKHEVDRKFYFHEAQNRPHIIGKENTKESNHPVSAARFGAGSREISYISPLDLYTNRVISASLYKGMLVEEKDRLLQLMRMFDERIMGVETVVRNRMPAAFIEMEDTGLVPISLFGDGLKKVLTLASAIVKTRGGVVLIDEFETGIHKRALVQVAKWLTAVTERYEVQVFLTTHSREAIDALVAAQEDYDGYDNISAYRLEHYKSKIYVQQFEGEDLYQFTTNQGMDIL